MNTLKIYLFYNLFTYLPSEWKKSIKVGLAVSEKPQTQWHEIINMSAIISFSENFVKMILTKFCIKIIIHYVLHLQYTTTHNTTWFK